MTLNGLRRRSVVTSKIPCSTAPAVEHILHLGTRIPAEYTGMRGMFKNLGEQIYFIITIFLAATNSPALIL